MALKRRETKPYTMEQMFFIINKNFIKNGPMVNEPIRHFVISPTSFRGENTQRWLVCDERQNDDREEEYDDLLPSYYGSTIHEAVERAYLDRKNHG